VSFDQQRFGYNGKQRRTANQTTIWVQWQTAPQRKPIVGDSQAAKPAARTPTMAVNVNFDGL
jgi:hypothetical protein